MAYYYNPDGIPWVPTSKEYWDDRLRKSRDETLEMLKYGWGDDKALVRHLNTLNQVIERRHIESEQSEANGNPPTTGEPTVQVADEPSIPQRQPDSVERSISPSSNTWTPITASSSGAVVRPSAQSYTEGQFAAYLRACNIPLFPYPLNEHSRFFPPDDHLDNQDVTTTVEERPSDGTILGTQGIWARVVGSDTSSDNTGDEKPP
ncbi:hypothetical protein FHL15_001765 [Xylaria flabelliformis]|uniref:Uncharacterized protein n=1 Tax=Xylaria flabelliformis TaxID=2512241 RepID=A0A553IBB1_9PEZI|nr:hypothetical protein FHL15_001765 [Xylaria flabelliformis]